jgi:hypothetical protein
MLGFHPYVGMTKTGSEFVAALNIHDRILKPDEVAAAGVEVFLTLRYRNPGSDVASKFTLCNFFSCYETQQLILGTGTAI